MCAGLENISSGVKRSNKQGRGVVKLNELSAVLQTLDANEHLTACGFSF